MDVRRLFIVLAVGFLVACSGAVTTQTSGPLPSASSAAPTASGTPPEATPGRTPTMPPPSPSPTPTPAVNIEEAQLRTWSYSGYVLAQVIVPVTNTGSTWVQLLPYESSYVIYGSDGSITARGEEGDFGFWPILLAPAETGYLAGATVSYEVNRHDFDRAEAHVRYEEASEFDRLEVTNTRVWRSNGHIDISGELINRGSFVVEYATVNAIFLDANGDILGYVRGSTTESVGPDRQAEFDGYEPLAGLRLRDIAETVFQASGFCRPPMPVPIC
jgi:hypothetical protein